MVLLLPSPPYSRLAVHYDRFVGRSQLLRALRLFRRCVALFGLRFSTAADFGCGSGLFARALARRWRVPVFAVDRSPHMLRVASRHCAGSRVTLLRGDFKGVTLPEPVDLITTFSYTLNLDDSTEALRQTLRSVWNNLKPGGCWIVDFLVPRPIFALGAEPGCASALSPARRSRRICLDLNIRSRHPHLWHRERHCGCLLSPVELSALLAERGFVLLGALDASDLGPPKSSSAEMVVVARKPVEPLRTLSARSACHVPLPL